MTATDITPKQSFTQQAFFSCIIASLLGSLLFPFVSILIGLFYGESIHIFEFEFIFRYFMTVGLACITSLVLMLIIGWPTLLILNKHKINHPLIASLSGFLITLTLWVTLFNSSFDTKALSAGLILGANGISYGFLASYFSRK